MKNLISKFQSISKVKLFLVVLTAVSLGGFFIFSAVPAAATSYEPTIGWWQSSNPDSGVIEYSAAQKHSSDYSVRLEAYEAFSPNDAHEVYVANPTGVDSLADLTNVAFWYYSPTGGDPVAPLIDVWLDTNGSYSREMPPTGDDEWLLGMIADIASYDTWVQVTLEDINWVRATGGTVYGTGSAGLTAALTSLTDLPILAIGVETGGPGTYISSRAGDQKIYIDDITINDTTYNLEPKVINTTQTKGYDTIQAAINDAISGDTINVAAGTHTTTGQVLINKNLSIVGDATNKPTISPVADLTANNDVASAWFLVNADVSFNLSNVILDGNGKKVQQAVRSHGTTSITNVDFANIVNSTNPYVGFAIANFGGIVTGGAGSDTHGSGGTASVLTVTDSTFANIGRVGILVKGTESTATITGNTYTGKGDGNFLDYAFEAGAGGSITATGNTISDNRGVASSDGSTSAGILVTDYYGTGTSATIENNTITNNTDGVAVGYNATDVSIATVHNNNLSGNTTGVNSTHPTVDATNNYWGTASGPADGAVTDNVDYAPWCENETCSSIRSFNVFIDSNTNGVHDESELTFNSIQSAITAASSSDTINVAAGTYVEAVNLTKSLILKGAPGAIIQPSNSDNPGVYINTADNVTVDGFEIDGTVGLIRVGISGLNSNYATLTNNVIHDIKDSPANNAGLGIILYGWDQSVNNALIQSNTIYNTDHHGIWIGAVESDGVTPITSNNNVIKDNTVHNSWQDPECGTSPEPCWGGAIGMDTASSSDIEGNSIYDTGGNQRDVMLINGFDNVSITDNTLVHSDDADAVTVGWMQPAIEIASANNSNLTITGNSITTQIGSSFADGFVVYLPDVGGTSSFQNNILTFTGANSPALRGLVLDGALTGDWTIQNNTFTGGGTLASNSPGIRLYEGLPATSNISISDNTINGWGYGIRSDALANAALVAVHQNSITGNSVNGLLDGGSAVSIDASNNWWGAASGPSGNGAGAGDAVSENVNYRPWLLEAGGTTYDQTIALTEVGQWTLFSAPTLLSEAPAVINDGEGDATLLVYEGGEFISPTEDNADIVKPVSAFYARTTHKGGVGFKYAVISGPTNTSKDLTTGWNLIGTNYLGYALDELSSILNTEQTAGMVTLYVPDTYNAGKDFRYTSWSSDADHDLNSIDSKTIDESGWGWKNLSEYDGYWVFMNAVKTFTKQIGL